MKLDLNNLPQDTQLLHQLVKELANDLSQKHTALNQKQALIDKQLQENQRLQRRLDELMRHRFGRRSQKINPDQLTLWQHALDEDIAETEQAIGKAQHSPAVKPKRKNKAKRKPLPANLPRQSVTYEHDQTHCACGHPLHKIGVQSCEELHWKPAEFYVIKHEQMTYGCRHCQSVTTAEKPSRPIEKGILGSSMLAYLLVSKYQDHIPIDRVTKICEQPHQFAHFHLNRRVGPLWLDIAPLGGTLTRIPDATKPLTHR
jgi:transposase